MNESDRSEGLLVELAEAVRLREGPAGVERFLWILSRRGAVTPRDLSAALGIPVPVVSALRREMEKRGLLDRGAGILLSEKGRELAENLWPGMPSRESLCAACGGTGVSLDSENGDLDVWIGNLCRRRPPSDVRLDQAHLDAASLLRKSLFLVREGLTAGRRVLFLGDDDFLSLAVLRAEAHLGFDPAGTSVRVVDVDPRIVEAVGTVAAEERLSLDAAVADVRDGLPEGFRACFDTVITDPPYTLGALDAFLTVAVDATRESPRGGRVALSFGRKGDAEQVAVGDLLSKHSLALRGYYPGFNTYEGAAVLAGVSDLYLLSLAETPAGAEPAPGPKEAFYTADVRPGPRWYRCAGCGRRVAVGPGRTAETIAELKAAGCPECGGRTFRYASP